MRRHIRHPRRTRPGPTPPKPTSTRPCPGPTFGSSVRRQQLHLLGSSLLPEDLAGGRITRWGGSRPSRQSLRPPLTPPARREPPDCLRLDARQLAPETALPPPRCRCSSGSGMGRQPWQLTRVRLGRVRHRLLGKRPRSRPLRSRHLSTQAHPLPHGGSRVKGGSCPCLQ